MGILWVFIDFNGDSNGFLWILMGILMGFYGF